MCIDIQNKTEGLGQRLRVGERWEWGWGGGSCDSLLSRKTKRPERLCTKGPRLGLLTERQIEVSVSQTPTACLWPPHHQVTVETGANVSGERSQGDHLLTCLRSVWGLRVPPCTGTNCSSCLPPGGRFQNDSKAPYKITLAETKSQK